MRISQYSFKPHHSTHTQAHRGRKTVLSQQGIPLTHDSFLMQPTRKSAAVAEAATATDCLILAEITHLNYVCKRCSTLGSKITQTEILISKNSYSQDIARQESTFHFPSTSLISGQKFLAAGSRALLEFVSWVLQSCQDYHLCLG